MKLNAQMNGTFSETRSIVSAKQTYTPNHQICQSTMLAASV